MRYEYHNFTENLNRMKNSKDMGMTRELILSEVTKVIEGKPALVERILVNCGLRVSGNPNKIELVTAVAGNLAQSSCLRSHLAKAIVKNQLPFIDGDFSRTFKNEWDTDVARDGFMRAAGYSNVGGTPGGASKGISGNTIVAGATQLLGTIAGIWSGGRTLKDNKDQRSHELNLATMNRDLMLEQMNLNANAPVAPVTQASMGGGGSNTIVWIIAGIGVIGIIGFAIYSARKGTGKTAVRPAATPAATPAPVAVPSVQTI